MDSMNGVKLRSRSLRSIRPEEQPPAHRFFFQHAAYIVEIAGPDKFCLYAVAVPLCLHITHRIETDH